MGTNPFDACLSDGVLERVEKIKSFREARAETLKRLEALNEARRTNHLSTGTVEHHREGDHTATTNRERSEAERADQEARDELHRTAREHPGPTRCPVVEPWSRQQEYSDEDFTRDEDYGREPPRAAPIRLFQQEEEECSTTQSVWDEDDTPAKKGLNLRQWWALILGILFGSFWIASLWDCDSIQGAIFGFFVCGGLYIFILRMSLFFCELGSSGGAPGGSFNGSGV